MNFIKILYNFIKGYLWQIFGLFLSLISLFVLQYLIFLTLGLYSYYYSLNTGFTPNISAQFNNSISKKEVDKIIENIKSKNDVDITYKGYFKELDDGFFVLENKDTGNLCQTLKKNIVLWAIDFDDKQEIEIYQDTKKFRCKVINIGKFGRWFIEISKPEYLQDGKCTIRYKDKIIDMEVYNKDDNAKLRLISNEFLPIFGNFLNDFLNRFIDIRYTGIGIDNYAHNINKSEEQNSFSVYSEKRILAYFNLIFGKSYDSNPVLITRNLMRDVSSYGYITSTILQNDNTTIDLEIIESFEFEPEKNYNTNLILMNKKNFDSIFNTKNKFNLINIYCDIFKEKKFSNLLIKNFPI
ncbi:uncharacterized protein Dvar_71230 [Desulfosarcina variabilis str. Montpellier]|uniref:hypothetical protein n=1 Tax=Desulfosarcina variabilis TaxID=2300 RepID=UPI003AFA85F8